MNKTPQHNTLEKKRAKKLTPWKEEYAAMGIFRMVPVHKAYLERFKIEMIEWFEQQEDVLIFEEFLRYKRLSRVCMANFMSRDKELEIAREYVRMLLAIRRERGGLTKKLDPGMIERSMPMYSEEWKDLQIWRSQLKAEQEIALATATGPKIVIMEKFPEIEKK